MNIFNNLEEVIACGEIPNDSIANADCLEAMKYIKSGSVDAIIADLPYQKMHVDWDIALPFEKLWPQYERIIKENGVIILFSVEPFTSIAVTSNLKLFKYDIIWQKSNITNFWAANKMV